VPVRISPQTKELFKKPPQRRQEHRLISRPKRHDGIDDQLVKETTPIADKSKIKFEGWAANVAAGTTPEAVYIALEGPAQAYIKANIGLNRSDVATAFKKPSVTNAGWIAFADLSALAAGSYKIKVIQTAAAAGLVCEIKSVIVIN
jgi:hypothetical protein